MENLLRLIKFPFLFTISNYFYIYLYVYIVQNIFCTELLYKKLKGHGNEADFLGFLHKPVWHRFLTLCFEPFRFWLQIRGDIRSQKTNSPSLGVNKIAYRYNFFKPLKVVTNEN